MDTATVCTTLSVLLLVVTALSLVNKPRIRRNGQNLRLAPNTLPIIGNGLAFLRPRHKLLSWFVECERLFGLETFAISVPSLPPGIVINDPRNVEAVLRSEDVFEKGHFFKLRSQDLFGDGIVNADGELWRLQRKAGLDFLNSANLQAFMTTSFPQYLQDLVSALDAASPTDVLDLEAHFTELTTQVMGRLAYNMDMHADDPFFTAFEKASSATGRRVQNPVWRITERILQPSLRRSFAHIQAFGRVIVCTAESQSESQSRTPTLMRSLLASLPDHDLVAASALNYLSAGRDTTAQALTWIFYLLMRHPHVAHQLRASASQSSTYALAILYESLRLFPPIPIELKQCTQPTTLPDGTDLPANAIVVWCIWAMNRSHTTWGGDALEFLPERWLRDGQLVLKSAYEFPVFNGGRRTCLGKTMAEKIAVAVMTALVDRYDFEPLDHDERISREALTLPMEGGLPARVRRRPHDEARMAHSG